MTKEKHPAAAKFPAHAVEDMTAFFKVLGDETRMRIVLLISEESSLTVRNRSRVDFTDLGESQPRRLVRSDPYPDNPRLVACDRVICQRRAVLIRINDLSVRYETQLYQSLETVTDTTHQTIPVVEKISYCFFDLSIAEECSDELRRAVRLVSAREASRNKYHL